MSRGKKNLPDLLGSSENAVLLLLKNYQKEPLIYLQKNRSDLQSSHFKFESSVSWRWKLELFGYRNFRFGFSHVFKITVDFASVWFGFG